MSYIIKKPVNTPVGGFLVKIKFTPIGDNSPQWRLRLAFALTPFCESKNYLS